jgi:ADP-ribose pyrophosphatase
MKEIKDSWRVLGSKTEYETGWYDGGYDEVEQPDGTTKRYYWADLPRTVVVVARVNDGGAKHGADSEDEVVFVEQYRPTVREVHAELPAGIVEEEESYAEAGERELREETGFVAEETELLQEYSVATGVLRHSRGIVFTEVTPGERREKSLDDNEFLSVERVPVSDALEVARRPPANDATIEGVLLAREDGYL